MPSKDKHDMQKALSWALRELGKRDASSVEEFLSQQLQDLAARVRREAIFGAILEYGTSPHPHPGQG